MTVSSEPRRRRLVLPDVTGLHVRNAVQVLRNAGLEAHSVQYTETYASELDVVETFPRPGQLVDPTRTIRLVVSRRNLINFLPQVYQQHATDPASFLRGFLYVIQHVADGAGDRLDRIHELFDPRSTDDEFLPWLASWLAVTLSPDWDALERRKMLLAATRLFPYRGTAYAIREFVRIYTGAEASIEENTWPFIGFRIGVASTIGIDTVILPPMNLAHCFVVRLGRTADQVGDDEIIKIHHIISAQKPAHTVYFLAFSDEVDGGDMQSFMTVGASVIGMQPDPAMAGGIGVGIGVGVAEPVQADPEPEPEAKPSRSRRRSTQADDAAKKKKAADQAAAEKKAADQAAAEKKAADDKAAAEKKAADDKAAAEKKAADDKAAAEKKAAADKADGAAAKRSSSRRKSAAAKDETPAEKPSSRRRSSAKKAADEPAAAAAGKDEAGADAADDEAAKARAARREARRKKAAEAKAAREKAKAAAGRKSPADQKKDAAAEDGADDKPAPKARSTSTRRKSTRASRSKASGKSKSTSTKKGGDE